MTATNYVLGFLFRAYGTEVALIGKIKSPAEAMRREFKEETGAEVLDWRNFATLTTLPKGDCTVYCFEARGSHQLHTMTAEPVVWCKVAEMERLKPVPSLRWLIPLALDEEQVTAVVYVKPKS